MIIGFGGKRGERRIYIIILIIINWYLRLLRTLGAQDRSGWDIREGCRRVQGLQPPAVTCSTDLRAPHTHPACPIVLCGCVCVFLFLLLFSPSPFKLLMSLVGVRCVCISDVWSIIKKVRFATQNQRRVVFFFFFLISLALKAWNDVR